MSTTILRPVLRPTNHPSLLHSLSQSSPLPSTSISSQPALTKTTYTCTPTRHARLLRRPKRPYTFTQLVTLSDGSAFTMRTTSPAPVYRSSRDTRNAPLWNPSSRELANVEDDEAGRLAGFRARFGMGFDAAKDKNAAGEDTDAPIPTPATSTSTGDATAARDGENGQQPQGEEPMKPVAGKKDTAKATEQEFEEEYYEFEEDDANLLDLISSYGQSPSAASKPPPAPKKGKK